MLTYEKRAVILGAGALVAPFLIRHLVEEGYRVEAFSRQRPRYLGEEGASFCWSQFDAESPKDWTVSAGALVFSLMPLWLLPRLVPRMEGAAHLVAFSSTSALAYAGSADPEEQNLAACLRQAELNTIGAAAGAKLNYTILRPTMIYGGGHDATVSAIARFVDRFHFFPVAAPGRGLRQPVHADDLAIAAISATRHETARGQLFELGGADVLRFRALVERVMEETGRAGRIVALPPGVLRAAFAVLGGRLRRRYSYGMFARMNVDQAFSNARARQAFGYAPRNFHLAPEDIPGPLRAPALSPRNTLNLG